MLDSLARVLLLDDDETRFLHSLANEADGTEPLDGDLTPAELATLLVRHGEASPYPLYAVDSYCNLIAWNQATTYYTDFAKLSLERQNMMWWLIATGEAKERLPHWETDTRRRGPLAHGHGSHRTDRRDGRRRCRPADRSRIPLERSSWDD